MADPGANAGEADTLEARLADAQKRTEDGEYGTIPSAIIKFGIRALWATEHSSCPASPRLVRNLEVAGLKGFADSTVPIPPEEDVELHGLPRSYKLMKRMTMVPGICESLDEDSLTSYILQDEAMQEEEQPAELILQASCAAPTKPNHQQEQRRKQGRGGSGGGQSTKDVDEKKSTRGKGRGGGGRRRECWICHDPDHLSYECHDHDDSNEDDSKGGRERSTSHRPRRDAKPHKEKQTSKKTSSTKDVDNSSGKGRGDGEASCSMAVAAVVQANPIAVLLESGCSHHLMGTKAVFVDMVPSDSMKHVHGFNGALQPVQGRGTVALQGEAGKRVLIPEVLYVPGVQANLLSGGQLKENGVQLQGDGDKMLLIAATGEKIVSATKSTPVRLHARLAHVGVDTIKSLAKHDVTTGLDIKPSTGADLPCLSCVRGKLARHTFPNKGLDFEEALAVVHIELCGPFRVAAKDGSLYFLLLKDRHTRFVWVMPVAKKSDVLRESPKWLVLVERQAKKSVLMLRSDQGGEFLGKEFTDFVDGKGIVHDLTCPYTPQQNGMAEREMCTAVESVRTSRPGPSTSSPTVAGRLHSSHPTPRSAPPKRGQGQQQLPLTEGSLEASPVVPASGIAGGRQCAKLVDKDVKPSMTGEQQTGEPVEKEAVAWVQSTGEQQTGRSTGEVSKSAGGDQPVKGDVVEVPVEKPKLRRLGRTRKPPERLVFHACLLPAAFTTVYDNVDDDRQYDNAEDDVDLPELDPDVHVDPGHRTDIATMTLKEAMASWKGKVVKATMEEEIRSLIGMGTWELVERPHGVNIMKNRWVLTTKYLIDDTVKREKARLVVKGFMQVYGADYDETYSPVSTYVTLRIFLSIVALLELNLMQLDMKNAFLQSKLDQVLYMYQPDYFDDGIDRVCKLLKSLYRLKQSPLLWYRALDGVLMGAGWKKSQVATALYFKGGDNGVTCWVLVYVDNLLAASSNTAMLKELKELLEAAFELREISPVIKNLGLEIICDRPSRKLRRRFTNEEQIEHISKTPVSVDACAELTFDDEEAQEREDEEYRQKVGLIQRIKCATISSTESEYVAAPDASKEGRRLRFLLAKFKLLDTGKPTILFVDNKSAITVAEGLGLTGNLKNMEQCYAWVQHMVRRGKFMLKYIPTTEQTAEFLTKALHFSSFRPVLCCHQPSASGRRRQQWRRDAAIGAVPFCTGGAVAAC
ncbi:unnamed protein product [Closterium sp. NIES-54]